METLLEALMNPADMTRPQVLLLVILLFVVIASLYFVWRLYRIVMTSRKTPYVPNIGLKRTGASGLRPTVPDAARKGGADSDGDERNTRARDSRDSN